jgi:hypothetical protein
MSKLALFPYIQISRVMSLLFIAALGTFFIQDGHRICVNTWHEVKGGADI